MVANIVFSGITNNFFSSAFENADPTSITSTRIDFVEQTTGYRTTITGSNLALDAGGNPTTGTMTSIDVRDASNNPVLSITGISWSLTQFASAIQEQLGDDEDGGVLAALLSQQPVNFTAAGANIGADFFFNGVTQPVTIMGSDHRDSLSGGDGDDTINPRTSDEYDGDVVYGSRGNDTIDLSLLGPNRWFEVTYEDFTGPVTVNVNGNTDTMTVNKGAAGTDTVLNVDNAYYGLTNYGSMQNDTFNITSGAGQWHSAKGMAGNDTFNLQLDDGGVFSLQYNGGWDGGPFTGVTANLATGVVSNDGFGGQDQINILGGNGRFEFRGTNFSDNITGSGRDERFRLLGGNDTLDAGDGWDVLRFDRNEVSQLNVDLSSETATGRWNGNVFSHQISNVEEVRGSNVGDNITGDAGDNRLEGNGGDDRLYGGDGSDRLFGGEGNDYLNPGDNVYEDYADAHSGNDIVEAGSVQTGFLTVGHYDLRNDAAQTVTLDMNVLNGFGNADLTIYKGAYGTTTVQNVSIPMSMGGFQIEGSELGDTFNLDFNAYGWFGIRGGEGNDTYNLSSSNGANPIVRLDFFKNISGEAASQSLNINLTTGVVANDGFGGQDQINGDYTGRIEVRGTDLADNIMGSDRDERFIGRAGNDTIDGQGGQDDLRFDRPDVDAGVKADLGAGTASGSFAGKAFQYTLANIENLRGSSFDDRFFGSKAANVLDGKGGDDMLFGDGAAAAYYGSTAANQVFRLYQATVDRAPDVGGHTGWSGLIASGERTVLQVIEGFVGSNEFKRIYSDSLTSTEFVDLLYNNVLGRGPDSGAQTWIDLLDSGARTQAQVVLGFSQSGEFIRNTTAAADAYAMNSLATTWSDEVFRLYQATLDRLPDAAGLTGWAESVASGKRTVLEVIEGFVGSGEFERTYSDSLSNTDFVGLLYNNVLGRGPDGSAQAWVDLLDSGARTKAEVVYGFSESGELRTKTQGPMKDWMRDQGVHDQITPGAGDNIVAGGQLVDMFIFNANDDGTTIVRDLEAWDFINLNGFGYNNQAEARSDMSQVGDDVVFDDLGVKITFENTLLAEITDDMILV